MSATVSLAIRYRSAENHSNANVHSLGALVGANDWMYIIYI